VNKIPAIRIFNVLAVVATITVNILANALPINGMNTGEISDNFKVFFVPAGYVFSIWGLIYLGLIAFSIFQILPSQWENIQLDKVGIWFIVSSLANIVWIFLWHYELFVLTVPVMLLLLLSLIMIYTKLGNGIQRVPPLEKWLVQVPFSIYLGWVSVATIANITSTLDYVKWDGFGIAPQIWAVIMLAIAVVLAFLIAFNRRDVAYLFVFVWAFVGIANKQANYPTVATAAYIATGAVVLAILVAVLKKPKSLEFVK